MATAVLPLFTQTARAATTLTLGHGAAPGNPRALGADKFAELVAAGTNGEIKINVAGSEQLGNDVAMLTSVRTGVLDFTINSQGAVGGIAPEINALGLPFLFNDAAHAYKVLSGPIGSNLVERIRSQDLTVLDWWDNGIRQITNSKKPIAEPHDLAGMKIRTPADAMTIDIFKELGAATEQIAFSELYIALQQGVVDGQENPLANIASSKLYEVNPYISLSGHKWESTPFIASVSVRKRVSEDQWQVIIDAAKQAGNLQRELMAQADEKYLGEFETNGDLNINQVNKTAFREATKPVLDKWRAKPFGDFVSMLIEAAVA